jgi:hypothetical protein
MRRFLTAVFFGALTFAPTAALAQSAQSQAVVTEWYSRFLHRPLDAGAVGWEVALDQGQSPDKILSAILGSDEFYIGSGSTPQGFVQALFTDVNGRQPAANEYTFWLNRLVQVGGAAPDFETRSDVAYEMLVRYPQNWVAVAPTVVAPTYVPPTTVVVPRVYGHDHIDYDRRFHDHDDRYEYRRPAVVPLHHDFDRHVDRGRHDEHDHDHKR